MFSLIIWRSWRDAARDEKGASAIEVALVLPLLLLVLFSIIKFGLVFNNYIQLTDGARAGARAFATSRSSPTPYTYATTSFYNSTPNLAKGSVTLTLMVNGADCSADAACQQQLSTAAGDPASLAACRTEVCD